MMKAPSRSRQQRKSKLWSVWAAGFLAAAVWAMPARTRAAHRSKRTTGVLYQRDYLRHGKRVSVFQDGARLALPLAARRARRVVAAVAAGYGLRVKAVEEIVRQGVSLVTLGPRKRLFARRSGWQKLADAVGRRTGVRWVGPVFFRGPATTVPSGRVWVYVKRGVDRAAVERRLSTLGLQLVGRIFAHHQVVIAKVRKAGIDVFDFAVKLAKRPGVDAVPELMRRYVPYLTPTDTYYEMQWTMANSGDNVVAAFGGQPLPALTGADIGAEAAWDETTGDVSVSIGVIDSGVDCTHPELSAKCLAGLNAITDDPDGSPPDPAVDLSAGHGTSVASVAAAGIDDQGVVGVCPECTIVPVRLIEANTFLTDAMMLRAFTHAVDEGAGVINNSWGPQAAGFFIPASNGEVEGFDYALQHGRGGLGALVVYAAGNENQSTSFLGHLQTGHENVIAVAASDQFDLKSEYSNYGAHITLAAPSSDGFLNPAVYAAEIVGNGNIGGDYTTAFGGTSSAAPVVSGVAALVLAVAPDLTVAELVGVLTAAADRVEPDGGRWDANDHSVKYGYGRVNAHRAVLLAQGLDDRPWCTNPAPDEDCDVHLDEDCDGWVDEGCLLAPTLGEVCATPADCGTAPFWQCPQTGKQQGLCTWDCSLEPCPPGAACIDGLCSLECAQDSECATDFVCSDDELGVCLPACVDHNDCGQGEVCNPDTSICELDTDGKVGSPCSEPDDCVDGGFCLSEMMGFPRGYCTRTCGTDQDCEGDDRCVFIADHGSFCYDGCSLDGDCREQYVCEQSGPRAGTCYKLCERDDQCTGGDPAWLGIVCDLASGRCVDDREPDAGVDAYVPDSAFQQDAAVEVDGPAPDATPIDGGVKKGGCGCRAGRPAQPGTVIVLWALFALCALLGWMKRGSRRPSR